MVGLGSRATRRPPTVLCGVLVVAAALSGCARVNIRVNAYLSGERAFPAPTPENSIAVLTTTEPPEPLLAAEITRKLERLLAERGYTITAQEEAKYVLFCFAAIDAGQRRRGIRPTHEPGRSGTTYYYGRHGYLAYRTTYTSGRTRYVPYEYTLYTRSLALELCERRRLVDTDEEEWRQAAVWRCSAVSPGPSSDLRWIANHLLLAAFEYFGQDTGKQQRVTVPYEDERVKDLARLADQRDAD